MRRILVVAVAACLALTACSADDDPVTAPSATFSSEPTLEPSPSTPAQPSDPQDAAAARQVVATYFGHLYAGEPRKACDQLSRAYQAASIEEGASLGVDPAQDCPAAISKVAIDVLRSAKLAKGSFKIGVGVTDGDSATVPVTAPAGFEDVTYALIRVGTRWYIDDDA